MGARTTSAAEVTIGDLLALPALAGTRLIPLDADPATPVTVVVPADGGPCPPGALLVAASAAAAAPPDGAAALLTAVAPDAAPAVPVLLIDDRERWGEVLHAVVTAVADAPRARADAARAVLRELLVAGSGHAAVVQAAAELLGAPVALVDAYGDLVAESGLTDAMRTALDAAVGQARAAEPVDLLGPLLATRITGAVARAVDGSAGHVAALVAWGRGVGGPVLAEVLDACAVEHARDEARLEAESRLRGELIEELIAGEVVSRESIVRRARLLGADLSNGAVGMIGTLRPEDGDEDAAVDDRSARRFVNQVRAVLDLHWPRALLDWNQGRLLVLLPTPPDLDEEGPGVDERAHTVARRLLSATRETVPGVAVTLALSRHTSEPERLGAALDEAELALSIGERLGRQGEVVTFEETGTYKLLFQIFADRPEELSSFYESTLAPLVAYDEQYQTELVGTLSTYLELDGNLAATAGRLYTHRHTVRYRLDRIAELSGLDVGRSDDREKLSLGLKAMRLLGRSVRIGPAERPARGRG